MEYWRQCSSCKKEIGFETKYYECSVSTCTGKRTGYVFCSVPCFERHLPGARHRSAGAIEKKSPTPQAWANELAGIPPTEASAPSPTRRIIVAPPTTGSTSSSTIISSSAQGHITEDDILIVVSKLKNYIRDRSDMNTSGDVADVLSRFVRRLCDSAIEEARRDGRKTVMARDFHSS